MSTEEKYQIALRTIYNTLKMREWEFTLKDKAIISDLLKAGYIEEYTEKNKNQAELKKENESLKKELEKLQTEIEELKTQLAEATKETEKDPEAPTDPDDNQKDK